MTDEHKVHSRDIVDGLKSAAEARLMVDNIHKAIEEMKNGLGKEVASKNELLFAKMETLILKSIAANNNDNLRPLREDVESLKSDRKAVKWIAIAFSSLASAAWTVAKELIK